MLVVTLNGVDLSLSLIRPYGSHWLTVFGMADWFPARAGFPINFIWVKYGFDTICVITIYSYPIQYYHNPGLSRTELSNLWIGITIRILPPHHHVPLQFRAIQAV